MFYKMVDRRTTLKQILENNTEIKVKYSHNGNIYYFKASKKDIQFLIGNLTITVRKGLFSQQKVSKKILAINPSDSLETICGKLFGKNIKTN